MFERAKPSSAATVPFNFDGLELLGREGESVAAALLANGIRAVRSAAVSGRPRGPYCMMGVCFECLVTINGAENQQACMIAVAANMVVTTQARPIPFAGAAQNLEAAS